MATELDERPAAAWWESCGFVQIFRAFGMALDWRKLILAAAGVVVTLVVAFVLDWIWLRAGHGVRPDALATYAGVGNLADAPEAADARIGVFAAFWAFERDCVHGALASARRGNVLGAAGVGGELFVSYPAGLATLGIVPNFVKGLTGVKWLLAKNVGYSLIFVPLALLIWSAVGGAVCRIAAVQFARNERLSPKQALLYAREKLWQGFFAAPVIPLIGLLILAGLLALGGLFLSIPYVGDLVGGLLFVLAIFVGFAIAFTLIGTIAGFNLLWPTVAAEGSDSFDAVSRSFSYVYQRPFRLLFYSFVAIIFGSICYAIVRLFVGVALASTHAAVNAGTIGTALGEIWAMGGMYDLLGPTPTAISGGDVIAYGLIRFWVSLVVVLVWAFLATYYFSASTIIYFLLRQAVDATDLEDVYIDTYDEDAEPPSITPTATPAPSTSLPVLNAAPAAASGASDPPPSPESESR